MRAAAGPGPAMGHRVPRKPAALCHLHRSHLQFQQNRSNISQLALASRPAASVVPPQNDAAAERFRRMPARATVSVVV